MSVSSELEPLIQPLCEDFATRPIKESFDWKNIGRIMRENRNVAEGDDLYLVVFRSQRNADADVELLTYHDDQAHEEALESPDLLHYFKGVASADGHCLSFCIWRNMEAARTASRGPKHMEAARLTGRMYASHSLGRGVIKLLPNDEVQIIPYSQHI